MSIEFNPMRSLIYVDCVKNEYRHKLEYYLHKCHIPDSISQFEPYVTKYAFYNALPVPEDGERVGAYNFQLTEHYWLVNPMVPELKIRALNEAFSPDVLKWQGIIPDVDIPEGGDAGFADADAVRASEGGNEMPPFVFAFLPMWWEMELKGETRTADDGPNYRWQFMLKYPEGTTEAADKWMLEEVLPAFAEMPEVTRILSSKVKQEINGCQFYRVVEIWFDGPTDWHKCVVEKAAPIRKPEWAQTDVFPYLKPKFGISSMFLSDLPTSDNIQQYRGLITMR